MSTATAFAKPNFAPAAVLGCALFLLSILAGCASNDKKTQAPPADASKVAIYESTELLHSQYSLVQHVWLDSWRSNFTVPSFTSESEGLEAMKRVASNAGANGLIHVLCVDARTRTSEAAKLYCYADAIRVH